MNSPVPFMRMIWLASVLLFTVIGIGLAQNEISGKVTDAASQQPMPYVNVYLPEYHKGMQTDGAGKFEIKNISGGKVLVQFSHVGYKTISKLVSDEHEKNNLLVEMQPAFITTEEVVVSGGTYSTQHQNAMKIDLLKSRDIEQAGTPSFMDALARMPGVDLISKGPGVAKPVIRGLSMTNVLMLNNGVKMENFQFSENHPFLVDEFGTDRVEIIKGPASLLYGSDAVGGVINVVKEKPAPVGKIVGDYHIQYHSNTRGVVSNLGLKGSTDHFYWGLRGGLKSHADYRDGNNQYVPNSRFNEYSVKATAGWNNSLGLFRLYYDLNRPKIGMTVGDVIPLIHENGRENKYWYQDLTNHLFSSRNTLFIKKYKVDVNAAYQMNNRKLQTDNGKPVFEMVDMDLSTFSYEVKTYFPTMSTSEYILGIQGANKTNRNHEAPNHVLPDADVNDFSFFGLAQSTFFDKLKLQTGLRYDYRHISTEAEQNKDAVKNNYGNVSASFGATYDFSGKVLLRANVASAYRTPNIAELTENGLHGVRYEQGNTDLKSQRSYEMDMSFHWHTPGFMFDVSGFSNHINRYIFIAPTDATTTEGFKIYRYTQSDTHLYGGEVAVDVLPVHWLAINTNYSMVIGKQNSGGYLPFIPQNKLRTELRFQKHQLGVLHQAFFCVGSLLAAEQKHPALFETPTDGYFLLHAGVGTEIKWANQMIALSVRGNNLLNRAYVDHLSTLKDLGYDNMGRNISFSIRIPFGIN
ncbi:TonB-dependent receptor [Prolixibacter bellariivorans]|uniref:TonB-dependent receptor n=1 Tax=Prolixibacter bellariivorans TaxID=314319 RepID=A0A5M4ATX1_9BACT|nr:TonB-dependent receptor [Prolixibacter bellariivorans]GET31352.1 TonB-dependent receptor [Prolixibacter bellariivorans]